MSLAPLDIAVLVVYILGLIGLGWWLSFRQKAKSSGDYFLAGKGLTWWAVGGSLIASNISAEQFIGMSGTGYDIGMAVAAYELMAAATLLIVAKYFLPVFLKRGIRTMPEFLEQRFGPQVRTGLAVFWLLLYVFVNITAVLYLGSVAIEHLFGVDALGEANIPMGWAIVGLVVYSASFSVFGGLRTVVWTDLIQVVVLIIGGLAATWAVLEAVGAGNGVFAGLHNLYAAAPKHFDLFLTPGDKGYAELPGWSVLLGGMWVANLYYWGMNQYIIQRALGAKSLAEAQRGVAFAALVKLLLPFIVILPGVAAYVLKADINTNDAAYPWVLANHVGVGLRGLTLAALIAAIGSSLSSMVNSASTIFTLDLYQPYLKPTASETHLVRVGKIAAGIALITGAVVAPALGNLDGAFNFIQEYTGFISPGVVVIFLFGLFWKQRSRLAALVVVLLSIPLSVALKFGAETMPFLNRMAVSFVVLAVLFVAITLFDRTRHIDHDPLPKSLFGTDTRFNVIALLILGVLAAVYILLG